MKGAIPPPAPLDLRHCDGLGIKSSERFYDLCRLLWNVETLL